MTAEKIFFEGFDISPLIKEFVLNKEFSYKTISSVFGPAPRILDSPDIDAQLDTWNEQAAYSSRIQRCEAKVREIIADAETELLAGGV